MQLLRGVDSIKDQSYFLASVHERSFRNTLFPVGHFTKAQVRGLAEEAGLSVALRRSSAGICFIGEDVLRTDPVVIACGHDITFSDLP